MKVKKAAKEAMESAIWGVAEHLRLENGGDHDEWIGEAAIQVADALVSLVCPCAPTPIPPGAWWDGVVLVLRDGVRVTADGGGSVRIQHPDRGRLRIQSTPEVQALADGLLAFIGQLEDDRRKGLARSEYPVEP